MKYYAVIFISVIVYGLLDHIIHELSHVFIGKMCGLKLKSIEWFRYRGGTKVTFDGEEKIIDENNHEVPKSWLYMNLAGMTATTLTGYILTVVFFMMPPSYIKLSIMTAAAMFLICDSGYAVFGAFNNCGDLYTINKYLGKRAYLSKIISVTVLIFDLTLFIFITRK